MIIKNRNRTIFFPDKYQQGTVRVSNLYQYDSTKNV